MPLKSKAARQVYWKSDKGKEIHERYYYKLKAEVYSHYGMSCRSCGFSDPRALSIDHINGGGGEHCRQIGGSGKTFYRWLRNNSFPDDFQVLCMNCQWIKRHTNNEMKRVEYADCSYKVF